MAAFLLDTSVYIGLFRKRRPWRPDDAGISPDDSLWLSAVVLEELYAGARAHQLSALYDLDREFQAIGRLVVPDLEDWRNAGMLLAAVGHKFGYELIGRSRLTNDALLASNASRLGLTLLTSNPRDFARLASLCPLTWREA